MQLLRVILRLICLQPQAASCRLRTADCTDLPSQSRKVGERAKLARLFEPKPRKVRRTLQQQNKLASFVSTNELKFASRKPRLQAAIETLRLVCCGKASEATKRASRVAKVIASMRRSKRRKCADY